MFLQRIPSGQWDELPTINPMRGQVLTNVNLAPLSVLICMDSCLSAHLCGMCLQVQLSIHFLTGG